VPQQIIINVQAAAPAAPASCPGTVVDRYWEAVSYVHRAVDEVESAPSLLNVADRYAAKVKTSEANGYSEAERVAIAWTVRNRAHKRGVSIAKLVCTPTCGPCCDGRPFSSAREATAANRELAKRVLAEPQTDDPMHGATAFFEPRVQDKLVA
jgi:hypothetical protein